MNLARPAAVIFDMDGLLLDTERIGRASMLEAVQAMGFPMTEAQYADVIGMPADTERAHLAGFFGEGFNFDDMNRRRRALDEQRFGLAPPLQPGALGIVETISRLGIPRAVATSSPRAHTLSHLRETGLLAYMDAVLTRDDVARGKPHPDLYLAAAAALGQAPAHCLALEDSYKGVRAAHAAGMPVIMVPDLLPPTGEMETLALAVVPSLGIVETWLVDSVYRVNSQPGSA